MLSIAPDQSSFNIASTLEASGKFDVLEFDILGERHGAPSDPMFSQQWNLDQTKLSSVYFYKLTAGSYTSVKKMLLMR